MKIALFTIPGISITVIRDVADEPYTTGTRVSECIEVDFPPRDPTEIAAILAKSKRERADKLRRELDEINNELSKVESA